MAHPLHDGEPSIAALYETPRRRQAGLSDAEHSGHPHPPVTGRKALYVNSGSPATSSHPARRERRDP